VLFDVYGRAMRVERDGAEWRCCWVGQDGKGRPANDIVVPAQLDADGVGGGYLGDLFHEWASEHHCEVHRVG